VAEAYQRGLHLPGRDGGVKAELMLDVAVASLGSAVGADAVQKCEVEVRAPGSEVRSNHAASLLSFQKRPIHSQSWMCPARAAAAGAAQ
jgi:hypothetical protein